MSLVVIPFKGTDDLRSKIDAFVAINFNGNRSEFLRVATEQYIDSAAGKKASMPAPFIEALDFVLELLKTDTASEQSWILLRQEVTRIWNMINHSV